MSTENQRSPHPIEGIWEPIKGELNGEPVPDMVLNHLTLTFKAGRYEMHFAKEAGDSGSYKLSSSDDGAHHVIILHRDKPAGEEATLMPKHFPSIYQLKGDRLRICHSLNGKLPTAFNADPGSNCYLITYKRRI